MRPWQPLSIFALALCAASACAQAGWPGVEAATQAQDWPLAAERLQALIRERPTDAQAHFRLAVVWLHLKRPMQADEELRRTEAIGFAPGPLAYRRAEQLALQGERDKAFDQLDVAVAQGLPPATHPDTDPLLEPLRSDARFAGFLQRYAQAVEPCRHDARYRQLDFWVGTWDVRPRGAAPDAPASENVITREYADCVVMEHWRSTGGGTGSSFNLFDASRGRWYQTWVDAGGGLHEYRGNPDAQGNMVFEGEVPGSPGQPARVPTRLTIYRLGPDTVRQFSESSTDGGKTWSVNYDFVYSRRPGTH